MITASKKPKTISTSSLTKLVSKHATGTHSVEKTSGTSRNTCKINTELNTVPDQHNVLLDNTVIPENYKYIFRSKLI